MSPSKLGITMASPQLQSLNFILIPLMAPGHTIPMIDMAKSLAKHRVNVTIIVTPLDATRFEPSVNRAVESGLSIKLLSIRFPSEEAGLPPGCESADCLPSYDLIKNFFVAISMLQEPVEDMLGSLKPGPSCIICDKHVTWTAETCNKFQIPRIIFDGMSCFTQLVMHSLYVTRAHESVPEPEPFTVPGLPDNIQFTKLQLPGIFNPGSMDIGDFRQQVRKTELQSYGVVVNTFEELEQRYVDEFRNVKGGKVWCVGPLSLFSNDYLDRAERGNRASIDTEQCMKWLHGRDPGSVVYACLGSLNRLALSQFVELSLGLEASNHPFILVVKSKSRDIEKWISDEGFEERTKQRGLLIRGWAPQVMILTHPAVGGFLTHCGWNSTLEGISAGLPMITWPTFAEQFLNEKLVVQVLGTGLGVGARAVVHLGEEENSKAKVTRDAIRGAIERVMGWGKEGSERRKRAQELGELAKRSVEVGGSSYTNVTSLIQEIAQLGKNKELID